VQEQGRIVAGESGAQVASKRSKYDKYCAYVINFSWLSANFTVLNFCMVRDFLINIEHRHNFKELLYVVSGSGAVRIDGEAEYKLNKGDLFYLDAGVKHMLIQESANPMRAAIMAFNISPGGAVDKIPRELVEDESKLIERIEENRYLAGRDIYGCGRMLRSIIDAMDTNHIGEFMKIKNSISDYILGAFQSLARLPEREDFSRLLEDTPTFNMVKIIQYMRRHYTDGITLSAVAEALHYSPRQCQRIIYECMGVSFTEILLDLQLTHSKRLLEATNETLEEIAEHSGFKNGKSFSRQFKDREGITPYRYRKTVQD